MSSGPNASAGTLERAIQIAAAVHEHHTDKSGERYILHPLRVMLACDSEDARIVAILHDVVEDSPEWTLDRLRAEGFDEDVIDGVTAVTKSPEEKGTEQGYFDFCKRAAGNPIGREVKRADLEDNMNVLRLQADLSDRDLERLKRYRKAYEIVR